MRPTLSGLTAALAMTAMASACALEKRGPAPAAPVSTDGQCGSNGGGASCPSGQCCSAAGYCGKTEDYCADPDCQYQFGTCDSNTTPAGPTTLNDPRPKLGSVTYTDDIIDCVADNVVALTYDDGPYLYTAQLLDLLKQYGFHATFFITGNNLGKGPIDTTAPYPDVIKRMIAEGHQVASHTWSHYSLTNLTTAMRQQQMVKNERALANIIGKYPTYMRPPFSDCTQASGCWKDLEKLGYHRVYFDLDTQDYLNDSPNLIQNSKNIVYDALFGSGNSSTDYLSIEHDIHQQTVVNLTSYFYDQIVAKGWKGVPVGECLQDPESNWYRTPTATASSSSKAASTVAPSSTALTTSVRPTPSSVSSSSSQGGAGTVTDTVTVTVRTRTTTSKPTTTPKPSPTSTSSENDGIVIVIPGVTTITVPDVGGVARTVIGGQ